MKRIAMALLVAVSCNAWADEASQRKVVDELLSLTPTERSLVAMRRQFDEQTREMVSTASQGKQPEALTPEQRAVAERFAGQVGKLFDEHLAWDKVKPVARKAYLDNFSEAELSELVVFYKTPLGQAMLTKMPVVTESLSRSIRDQLQLLLPKLDRAGQQFQREFGLASASDHAGATDK